MDIRVLKYFLAVAQEENITKASEILHTTQPNVSRQIADLEKELGKPLFNRNGRTLTLTQEGMFLRRRAQEIVELVERTEEDFLHIDEVINGTIHIGAIETDAMHFFGDVFLNLHNTFPGIKYNLFSGSIAEISEGILKGILDFGIVVAPLDMSQFDYLRLPMSDTFGLLMSKDNELSKKDKITPKDIKDHPVWVANQQLEGNVLSSWLKKDVSQLNIVSTFNLVTTPAMMVEQGFGMVFTFANLIDTTGNRNLCFKPLDPPIEATLYLVWKKYQLFTPAAKKFLEYVQNSL